MSNFMGFTEPEENWSKLPHEFIGHMNDIDSLAEMKVVLYILRHTWGYHDKQGNHETEKRISLDEFCNGRKLKGGERMDAGTGMSINAVRDGIKRAIEDGFIEIASKDETDRARVKTWYALAMRVSKVDTHLSEVDTLPSEVDTRTKKDTLERNLEKERSTGDAKNASQPPAPPITFESLERMGDEPPQPLKDAAIQVFREVRGKNPPKETYAQIEEAVGCEPVSLDFWRKVLVEYAALGWNRQSVSGPLDWFRKRELPHVERKNGGGKGKPGLIDTINAGFALYDKVKHGKRTDGQDDPFPDAINVSTSAD